MRQEVYVKFAEAIRAGRAVKAAEVRHTLVQVKFAAAVALVHVSQQGVKKADFASGMYWGDAYGYPTPGRSPAVTATKPLDIGGIMRKYITPANAVGAIAGLGGGALLAKGLGLKPSHVLGAGLGAGLLYGSYQLYKNPQLRGLVNQYGQKAISFLGRNLGAAYKGLTA